MTKKAEQVERVREEFILKAEKQNDREWGKAADKGLDPPPYVDMSARVIKLMAAEILKLRLAKLKLNTTLTWERICRGKE